MYCLSFLLLTALPYSAAELLKNADFEQSVGSNNWVCNSCNGQLVNDARSGSRAFLATGRTSTWQGPWQKLEYGSQIVIGRTYSFNGYVKLRPRSNSSPQRFSVTLLYKTSSGSSTYRGIVGQDNITPNNGWVKLSGQFTVENLGQSEMSLYVEGPESGYEFISDSFSLLETNNNGGSPTAAAAAPPTSSPPATGSWRDQARSKIDAIRKSDLTVSLSTSSSKSNVQIKVEQLTHEFGFGSAVDSATFTSNQAYRNWYLNNFEWAVLENDMKWRQTEGQRGVFTWQRSDDAMRILESNGKKVRGHAIFWAVTERNPDWVKQITQRSEIHSVCMKRVDDILGRYRGRIEHWDVNNEMLEGSFFKDKYGSSQIRYDMFKRARQADPNTKLFLNDFNVVSNDYRTQPYINLAREFINAGVPVDGLGVQGHYSEVQSGQTIWGRLDKLAALGKPIWVTELDFATSNSQQRADFLEEALYAFFSHSSVQGVLHWGFWDGRHWRGAEAAMVNGSNMSPNAAGQMWQRLFHTEWRTKVTDSAGNLSAGASYNKKIRAFKGSYKITVTTNDQMVQERQITLGSSPQTVNINI